MDASTSSLFNFLSSVATISRYSLMAWSFVSMILLRNLTSYFFFRRLCCALTTLRQFYLVLTSISSSFAVASFALISAILSCAPFTYLSQSSLLRPRFFGFYFSDWLELASSPPESLLFAFFYLFRTGAARVAAALDLIFYAWTAAFFEGTVFGWVPLGLTRGMTGWADGAFI